MKPHKHSFKPAWRSQLKKSFSCKCGEKYERDTTKSEQQKAARDYKKRVALSDKANKVWREFVKKFRDGGAWNWEGAELQSRVEQWAEKYPDDVMVHGIDDSHFCSSDIVFVLHRVKKRLWGTTCVVITQCDGQPPCEFFMYPGHRFGIQNALVKMSKLKPWKD